MKLKHCGGCSKDKTLKEFASHADTYDGKQTQCRLCSNAKGLKRYYSLKNMYLGERI